MGKLEDLRLVLWLPLLGIFAATPQVSQRIRSHFDMSEGAGMGRGTWAKAGIARSRLCCALQSRPSEASRLTMWHASSAPSLASSLALFPAMPSMKVGKLRSIALLTLGSGSPRSNRKGLAYNKEDVSKSTMFSPRLL